MKKTNFDAYLEEQLKYKTFAERFERAGEAWDVALQLVALRESSGMSQPLLRIPWTATIRRPLTKK